MPRACTHPNDPGGLGSERAVLSHTHIHTMLPRLPAKGVLRGSLVHLTAVMALFVLDGVVPRYLG